MRYDHIRYGRREGEEDPVVPPDHVPEPIKEPPVPPKTEPDAPVREPGPTGPKRLAHLL